MACPLCGEVCRCTPESTDELALRRGRFQLDTADGSAAIQPAVLIDPETRDSSENQLPPSLRAIHRGGRRVRFVVEDDESARRSSGSTEDGLATITAAEPREAMAEPHYAPSMPADPEPAAETDDASAGLTALPPDSGQHTPVDKTIEGKGPDEITSPDATFWKDEVAARLNYYRARRKPRPPKYPSLRLKFDAPGREFSDDPARYSQTGRESVALQSVEAPSLVQRAANSPLPVDSKPNLSGETAQIIEFPRPYELPIYTPPSSMDELAEPVFDHPRIVEVPEIVPPAPALGGIVLESDEPELERRPGFEIPLQAAPLRRRLFASVCDAAVVLVACGLFFYIFYKISAPFLPFRQTATAGAALIILFWATYQYLLLTCAATTPGLRLARLRLRRFDGSPVDRRLRRWRVIASLLSGLSLGLGYAWCFLDEDTLCWHDRITRTYLEPL